MSTAPTATRRPQITSVESLFVTSNWNPPGLVDATYMPDKAVKTVVKENQFKKVYFSKLRFYIPLFPRAINI